MCFLITSNGSPLTQDFFLSTHFPRCIPSDPICSCHSLLPMMEFLQCLKTSLPCLQCNGLHGKASSYRFSSHRCSLLATLRSPWTIYVSDAMLSCISKTLPILLSSLSHLHLLPAPLRFLILTHPPDSCLGATSCRRSSPSFKSQWPSALWTPRARVPTSEHGLWVRKTWIWIQVDHLLAVWSWMSYPFRLKFPYP